MLIAFEGPDEVGKSTSATNLSYNHKPVYNATVDNYAAVKADLANEPEVVQTFDRIDWFTHLVYRLSLPEFEWNDQRVRTVFAMPDTHLVVKIHRLDHQGNIEANVEAVGEGYQPGNLDLVTQTYIHAVDLLARLNFMRDYNLFKTITMLEVYNDPKTGAFEQKVSHMSAPGWDRLYDLSSVHDDASLLDLLRYADDRIG
ncbi:AAA-ATPase [Microbacterium phage Raccoon]|uniref:AAA-ATPase n=1 Tax=Microbacterium phage Raccoon TaxID=2079590 RepID=A0A2L0HNH4_9CAUD|nr:AAA-ATPase [Microbacterium phage Raccoon]